MSALRGAIVAFLAAASVIAAAGPERAAEATSFPVADRFDATSRPLGGITVIGDSVLYGSVVFGPHVGEQLAARGWGPVRVRGGGSYTTGYFAVGNATRASYWIDLWQQQGWDPRTVIVNLGTNDSGLCRTDLACARAAILHVVEAIGPGHRIWWPMITRSDRDAAYAANWNLALQQIADERDDVFTWDWPAAMRADGITSHDNIHLSPDGYRRRSVLLAEQATLDLARADRVGVDAALPDPSGGPTGLVPLTPTRVLDTRLESSRPSSGSTVELDLTGLLPDGTTAVAAYVAAVNPADRGHLTVHDCELGRPVASAANHEAGRTRGAVAVSSIGASARLCVFTRSDADIVVDLQAAFVPFAGLRFDPLTVPERLHDSRVDGPDDTAGATIRVTVDPDAAAVALSITAIGGVDPGFVTVDDCADERPVVATLNHGPAEIVAGSAFAEVGEQGEICVFLRADADVTVDLMGTFAPDAELGFVVAAQPTRTLDTRTAVGGWSPIQGAGQTIDVRVAPPGAQAVTGTLTLVEPLAPSHLRAWGCGELPPTANVNAATGRALANSVTTGVDADGRMCLFARSPGGTVFDTVGWWVPAA